MPRIVCPNCGNVMIFQNPTCPVCGVDLTLGAAGSPIISSPTSPPVSSPTSSSPPWPTSSSSSGWPITGSGTTPPITGSSGASMTVARPSFPHSDLEGTVKYQPAVSERTAGIDWSQWFLSCLFAPVLLLVRPAFLIGGMLHLGRYHGRKIPVLLASIEESGSGGILRQARFEGELTLSGVNQGDEVSLWGKMRGGVLLVKGGYNYTHSADIKLQQRHIPYVWRSIAYAVIAVIVLVILTTLLSSPH